MKGKFISVALIFILILVLIQLRPLRNNIADYACGYSVINSELFTDLSMCIHAIRGFVGTCFAVLIVLFVLRCWKDDLII